MLVLSRKPKESFIIIAPDGVEIEIFVSEIRTQDKVRIAIEAPKEYQIQRREVYDAIKRDGYNKKESRPCTEAPKNTTPATPLMPFGSVNPLACAPCSSAGT